MIKWIVGILAVVILLVALAFTSLIWMVMAGDLQKNLEDNLTILRQHLIMNDRQLSFSYEDGGIEMKGLQPVYTLIQPLIIYKKGADEYRFSSDELSFHGSFSGNEMVRLESPPKIQMTHKSGDNFPKILMLDFEEVMELELLSADEKSHLWNRYQSPNHQSGVIKVMQADKIEGRVDYNFYKLPAQNLRPPYSPHIDKAIKHIEAKVE